MSGWRLPTWCAALFVLCAVGCPAHAADDAGDTPTIEVQGRRAPPPPHPLGRLGDAVRPTAYRLDLTVDPAQARFSGHAEIAVVLAASAKEVFLHGRDLNVGRVVAQVGSRTIPGAWSQLDRYGAARIAFPEPLPAGPATLVFDYDAPFGDTAAGMFHVRVDGAWYSWTQFQSTDARAAFPGFDEPGFKTPFEVTLRTPAGLKAIANGPELPLTHEGTLDVHRFAPIAPLPTYLVAMMVGPFVTQEGSVEPTRQRADPLPLRIVSTRQNAGRLDYARENSGQIVRLLEDYFGEPFPYPKLDQITTPILPGAMENAGADLYRDDLLVMDRNAPLAQQKEFGRIVAHELAHQWFGDLVTPAWWDDLWLNESFANAMGYLIGQAWRPDLDIWSGTLDEGFAAMEVDSLRAGRAVRQPITATAQIDSAFDPITYGKGGHVLAMMGAYMGEARFRDGVRRYIAAHRHGTATSADFFAALSQAADDPRIVSSLRSFVEQQGVPLLVFGRDGERFNATQIRYAPLGQPTPATRWIIPVCVRRGAVRQCKIMDGRSASFDVPGTEPLVPNAWGTGYYRFDMPRRMWQALIGAGRSLTAGEALSVADSLSASIMAGRGTVAELARLSSELSHHTDSRAAFAADGELSKLVKMGLVDVPGRVGWVRLRQRLYGPLLKRYGFDPRAGVYAREAPARMRWRTAMLGALLGTPRGAKLRRQLQDAAARYLAGDRSALDEAWIDHGFDLYIVDGGEDAARALVEYALSSEDPVARPAALVAAARSSRTAIASWMLGLADPRLRASERLDILDGVMARRATRSLGYDWIVANLDSLLKGSEGPFYASRIATALGQFCSIGQSEQMIRDLRPRFAGTAAALQLERSIEQVRNCGTLDNELGSAISEEFAGLK
ncbi:M1 family metallopeptidase [Novosphingobium sp. 9U]|uniref:M1 family metallopeptidase n=1 Tax=Novosphingobium sp. 9U TaxID=2653158 RepID=UPI0012F3700D|nr:M1 family metallopeptidase [Novosphingobium sp. 9U]VWX53355.1 Aminopeptidase [Novosphingobium sp. 9U]